MPKDGVSGTQWPGGGVCVQQVWGQGVSTAGLGAAEMSCRLQFATVNSQPLVSRCPSSIAVTIPTDSSRFLRLFTVATYGKVKEWGKERNAWAEN